MKGLWRPMRLSREGKSNKTRNFQGDPFIKRPWTTLFNRSGPIWCISKQQMKQEQSPAGFKKGKLQKKRIDLCKYCHKNKKLVCQVKFVHLFSCLWLESFSSLRGWIRCKFDGTAVHLVQSKFSWAYMKLQLFGLAKSSQPCLLEITFLLYITIFFTIMFW